MPQSLKTLYYLKSVSVQLLCFYTQIRSAEIHTSYRQRAHQKRSNRTIIAIMSLLCTIGFILFNIAIQNSKIDYLQNRFNNDRTLQMNKELTHWMDGIMNDWRYKQLSLDHRKWLQDLPSNDLSQQQRDWIELKLKEPIYEEPPQLDEEAPKSEPNSTRKQKRRLRARKRPRGKKQDQTDLPRAVIIPFATPVQQP